MKYSMVFGSRTLLLSAIIGVSHIFLLGVFGCSMYGGNSPLSPQEQNRTYACKDNAIRTSDGSRLFLKGLNLSGTAKTAKDFMFNLKQSDLDVFKEASVNSVRLLTFWRAIAPYGPTSFDSDYLEKLNAEAGILQENGMYIILDMHQDLWGDPFASHGAPAWACPDELKQGYKSSSPWWINYTKPQVIACFDNFYSTQYLIDSFARAWAEAASTLCHLDKLVGFDLFNEPFPGSSLGDKDFDKKVLFPIYLRVMNAIEKVCPGRIYFLEPNISYQMGISEPFAIPESVRDRIAFSPHFYPRDVHEPEAKGYDLDKSRLEEDFMSLVTPYQEQGVPIWLGEYGGITANPNFGQYIKDLNAVLVKHFISSALWDYYSSDSGFAFLDSQGHEKAVFDPVFGAPMFSVFPNKPDLLTAEWEQGNIKSSFDCTKGRYLEILSGRKASCTSSAPAAMEGMDIKAGEKVRLYCAKDGKVDMCCTWK
ncbi:MAG: glycoside hydrolase family 5 protein [Deltaproteobacteria bacterium]|nr:glycoside hydrolase family 5 protein [Deltaproteobacteria bacterium]